MGDQALSLPNNPYSALPDCTYDATALRYRPIVGITKRILCLANSRKLNGRCIAGIELVNGDPAKWIRPVSNREHQEVSEYERQYEDGSDPRALDIIDIPLLEKRPNSYQTENWLLNSEHYWNKIDQVNSEVLHELCRMPGELWINRHSTQHGLNDAVLLRDSEILRSSLTLINVKAISIKVFAPGQTFGNRKRRVQASFSYAGIRYRLWVTDPVYESRYLAHPDGDHLLGPCFLTISLGEPFQGRCYKLVAAIIEEQRAEGTSNA